MILGKRYQIIWLIALLFLASSCLNSDECVEETYSSPKAFNLNLIDEEGTNLINENGYHIDSIHLYYTSNLGSTLVPISFIEISDGFLLTSSELPYTILETSNDIYFLYLNVQDTDTLTINILQETDGCSTWHRYVDCMYNNEIMEIDPEIFAYVGVK